jgi:DNA-binding CsgD family transcriptional regulator
MKPQQYPAIDILDGGRRTKLRVIKSLVNQKRNSKRAVNDFLITFQVKGNKFEDILRESIRSIIIEELSFFVDNNYQQKNEFPPAVSENLPVLMLNNYRQLTPKEIEVMDLVLLDFTNRKIGIRLNMQLSTVKNHLKSINNKLGVKDRKTSCSVYCKLYNKPDLVPK